MQLLSIGLRGFRRSKAEWPAGEGRLELFRQLWRRRYIKWGILLLPSILSALYFFLVAADRYESEARFVVRSSARPEISGGMTFLVQLGLAKSQDDSFIVQNFMTSRDAIDQLRQRLPLTEMFDREGADFLARYPSLLFGPTKERFHKYFQRMVSVIHIDQSGISTLRVQAFRPEDARRLAESLLALSEGLINRLNQRLHGDAISSSQHEMEKAQQRLVQAQATLTDFRNRELMLDPGQNAAALAELIAQLSADLASTQAQLIQMRSGSAGSPQLQSLQGKAAALQEQIAKERGRIAADSGGLATRIAAYERLSLEREFANKMTNAAEAELVRSRTEASRQMLYLERIVEPHLADYSTEPRRMRNVAMILGANLLLLLIGWLILSGVREHAQ